jgi:hypothetical protein
MSIDAPKTPDADERLETMFEDIKSAVSRAAGNVMREHRLLNPSQSEQLLVDLRLIAAAHLGDALNGSKATSHVKEPIRPL